MQEDIDRWENEGGKPMDNIIDSVYKSISKCAACGNDHDAILVKELAVPVNIDGREYWFFYFCPETGDGIYLRDDEYQGLEDG